MENRDTEFQGKTLGLLWKWINQRPGLEFANYGERTAYFSESRRITRQLHDARTLLRACKWVSFTPEEIQAAFRAYSGRLVLKLDADGMPAQLDYCTGQYWPTEYRAAVCAVLASLLWDRTRFHCMPTPAFVCACATFGDMAAAEKYAAGIHERTGAFAAIEERYQGMRADDWIRSHFRREFGPNMARRWFD